MVAPQYATREQLKSASDVKETSRNNQQVDRALKSASRTVEGLLHRKFYPYTATRYRDWPNRLSVRPWRLYLDDDLVSVSLLTAGGVTVASNEYFLEPNDAGPPYYAIEINLASSAAFQSNTGTQQRSVAITGVWGYDANEDTVGALAAGLGSLATDTATITWTTARVGVGDILRIDSERMIVTERTMIDSGQNLGGSGLTGLNNNVTVAVTTGTAFAVDETILIDSERMLIVDIAGNNLIVKRAWDGSILAAHSAGVDIYALTGVELARGQLGTAAAAHSNGATIYRYLVPGLVTDLTIAEAINQMQQEDNGYGKGANAGVQALRDQARMTFGRNLRMRSV